MNIANVGQSSACMHAVIIDTSSTETNHYLASERRGSE